MRGERNPSVHREHRDALAFGRRCGQLGHAGRGEQRRAQASGERAVPRHGTTAELLGQHRELERAAALASGVLVEADPGPALADRQRIGLRDLAGLGPAANDRELRLARDNTGDGFTQEFLLLAPVEPHTLEYKRAFTDAQPAHSGHRSNYANGR